LRIVGVLLYACGVLSTTREGEFMGSVDALAKWLNEKPRNEGAATVVQQIRLHRDTARTLAYLSDRYGMPKATLAAELLSAAIKDALRATPGNVRAGDLGLGQEEGVDPDELVHDFSGFRADDEDSVREVS
jgi:hypothetical protein